MAHDAGTLQTALAAHLGTNITAATVSAGGVIALTTTANIGLATSAFTPGTPFAAVGTTSAVANLGLTTATASNGTAAINSVNAAITKIGTTLSSLGSATIQLKGLSDFTDQLSTSVTTSLGSLVDANLSEESAMLSSLQTKQSLAIQSLSLANQGPGALLQLFR
jgi:flagellin